MSAKIAFAKMDVKQRESSTYPPLTKIVDVDKIDEFVQVLTLDEISKILECEVRKIAKNVYALRRGRRLTVSLITHVVDCEAYFYYTVALGSQLVTRRQLYAMTRGVIAHRLYYRKVARALRDFELVLEVYVEGNIHGLDVVGKPDIISVHVGEKRRRGKCEVIGDEVHVVEVKTSRDLYIAHVVQTLLYVKLLDIDAVPHVVYRDRAVVLTYSDKLVTEIVERARRVLALRHPPEVEASEKCAFCPLKILNVCESYIT